MRWPSLKFFQTITGVGFIFALANSSAQKSGRVKAQQEMLELKNSIAELRSSINQLDLSQSVSIEQKQALLDIIHNKVIHILNSNPHIVQSMSNADSIIIKIAKNNDLIHQLNNKLQIVRPYSEEYLAILKQISDLQQYNSGLTVQVSDYLGIINYGIKTTNSKILEALEDLRRNFTNPLGDLINDFQNWLNVITYEQNIAIINILGIILIMLSLISIIFIFYGNILLDYLKLEERYPRIAKLIILRRKFQQFYLLINILIISVVSIIIFAMNLTLF